MMNTEPSRFRGFIIFGGFVFLLTLFVSGFSRTRTVPFFVPADEIPHRLPFSIVAGVVFGLIYAVILRKRP
jgi:hypothetical protein